MSADIEYRATLTASEFHHDAHSFVKLLMGPVGTGKSVACCFDPLKIAINQAPDSEGIRRTRGAIIRSTYPELKSTTIATWKTWYPEDRYGKIKWDSPIVHHLKFDLPDGTKIDCEVLFLPLETVEDIQKLRSLELTWIYINEAQYTHYKIFLTCTERVNRYPPIKYGAPITWSGVIMDANPPDMDHWIYTKIDKLRPEGYRIFRYKPAVLKVAEIPKDGTPYKISLSGSVYINNPDADYVWVQPDPNYWLKLVPGRTDEEIKVILQGEYGMLVDGKAVHPSYNDHLHFSNKELKANDTIEIGLGWDFGNTPACAIGQLTPRGKFVILDELWTEDMDLRDFAENIVIPHLDVYYPFWRKNYASVHDPAGSTGAQTDGRSCQDILRELGITSHAAATNNDPTPRKDGLNYFLGKLVDGEAAFSISVRCKMIRKGLMGAYQYARVKVGGDERYHEKPLKNIYSHICEALQYLAMKYAAITKKPPPSDEKPYRINRGSFYSQ